MSSHSERQNLRGVNYSRGFPSWAGQRGASPSTLLLPSAALYTTPLSSRDLIMEDSLAMRTEPVCVWDGLKRGTSPMCKTKGWESRRLGEIVKEGKEERRDEQQAVECGARVDNITGRKVWLQYHSKAYSLRYQIVITAADGWGMLPADLCFVIVRFMCI